MSTSLTHYLIFTLSLIAGIMMTAEGSYILLAKKAVTPLPSRILYALGLLVVGSEKSKQQFLGRASQKDLRIYAVWVVVFGLLMLVSSISYLLTTVL